MKLPIAFRFSTRERCAVVISLTFLIIGLWLGVKVHADWLSRFGALIIIVGVVFAISDLPMALERRARAIAKVTSALVFQDLLKKFEEENHQTLTHAERYELWRRHEILNNENIEREASRPRKRFLIVEATIICAGTFVNGFGQWIVTLLRFHT